MDREYIKKELNTFIDQYYINPKTEIELLKVIQEFSECTHINSSFKSFDNKEIGLLRNEIIKDEKNKLFFEHLMLEIHKTFSDPINKNSKSVQKSQYFSLILHHVINCNETSCNKVGCFLSKSVMHHFYQEQEFEKFSDCGICRMTRNNIQQSINKHNINLITNKSVEIVSKKTQNLNSNLSHSSSCINDVNEIDVEKKDNMCLICHTTDTDNENNMFIKVKCCSHIYHRQCLIQWFERKIDKFSLGISTKDYTCPTCRKVFI